MYDCEGTWQNCWRVCVRAKTLYYWAAFTCLNTLRRERGQREDLFNFSIMTIVDPHPEAHPIKPFVLFPSKSSRWNSSWIGWKISIELSIANRLQNCWKIFEIRSRGLYFKSLLRLISFKLLIETNVKILRWNFQNYPPFSKE